MQRSVDTRNIGKCIGDIDGGHGLVRKKATKSTIKSRTGMVKVIHMSKIQSMCPSQLFNIENCSRCPFKSNRRGKKQRPMVWKNFVEKQTKHHEKYTLFQRAYEKNDTREFMKNDQKSGGKETKQEKNRVCAWAAKNERNENGNKKVLSEQLSIASDK